MNPLRKQFTIKTGAGEFPLCLDFGQFTMAQRELKVDIFPLGEAEIWNGDQVDGYANMVFFYVGLRASVPKLTLDWIASNVMTLEYMGAARKQLSEAIEDFFRRLCQSQGLDYDAVKAQAEKANEDQASTTTGLLPSLTSDSPQTSSGV